MANDPYSYNAKQNTWSGYGTQGTNTPEAVMNRSSQIPAPGKSGNLYESILRLLPPPKKPAAAFGTAVDDTNGPAIPANIAPPSLGGGPGPSQSFMGDPNYGHAQDPNAPNNPWMPPSGVQPSFGGAAGPGAPSMPAQPGAPGQPSMPGAPAPGLPWLPPSAAPPSSAGGYGPPGDAAPNEPSIYPGRSHAIQPVFGGGPTLPPSGFVDPNAPMQELAYSSAVPPAGAPPSSQLGGAAGPDDNAANDPTWYPGKPHVVAPVGGGAPSLPGSPIDPNAPQTALAYSSPGGHKASITDPPPTVPGRGRGVTPGAPLPNQVPPPPPPTPAAPVMPSFAGQERGQPLAAGNTGENASDKAMRWKQGLIASGDPDGLSQYVTPFAIDFYEKNNPNQLDPVSWLKDPANIAALTKATGAPTQMGTPVAGGVGGAFNPNNPFNNPNNPGWNPAGAPSSSGPIAAATPPPGLPNEGGYGPNPLAGALPQEGAGTPGAGVTAPPPGLPNEGGFGPTQQLQQQLGGGGGQPSGSPPGGQPAPPPTGSPVADRIHQLYAPLFQQQQGDLAKRLNANAAVIGDINAGGYSQGTGENSFNRQMGNLSAQQGSQEAGFLQQANENSLNRGVDIYGTQAKMFGDKIAAETQRLGITTNDSLQRWLDTQDNAFKQRGIDKNDLLERYKAELAKKGSDYAADRGVDAAALHAASAAAASSAASQASLQAAQMQYALGEKRLGLDTTSMQNQYNLDSSKLGLERYMFDTPNINTLLQMYSNMSPEQLASAGAGTPMYPNYMFQPNQQFDWSKLFASP